MDFLLRKSEPPRTSRDAAHWRVVVGADRRSGRLGFSGPVELCIVFVLVEEGTATTVVLVEFKRCLKGLKSVWCSGTWIALRP